MKKEANLNNMTIPTLLNWMRICSSGKMHLLSFMFFFCNMISVPVLASEDSENPLSFSGFGTIGSTYLNRDDRDFVQQRILQNEGAGRTDNWTAKVDSVLGLQLDYQLSPDLVASLQGAVKQNPKGDMAPEFTLAMVRWNFSDDWRMRVGRMQNPQFIFSDTWLVNYGQAHARPRAEVYFLYPFYALDGLTLDYGFDLLNWRANLLLGWSQLQGVRWRNGHNGELIGPIANLSLSREEWIVKVSYSDFTVSTSPTDFDPLFNALETIDPALIGRIRIIDADWRVAAIGIEFNHGPWHAVLEAAHRYAGPTLNTQKHSVGSYLTLEYRFSSASIYTSVFYVNTEVDYNEYLGSPAYPLIRAAQATAEYGQRGYALGTQVQLSEHINGRVQLDRIFAEDNNLGLFIHHNADFNRQNPAPVTALSINLDFLF